MKLSSKILFNDYTCTVYMELKRTYSSFAAASCKVSDILAPMISQWNWYFWLKKSESVDRERIFGELKVILRLEF